MNLNDTMEHLASYQDGEDEELAMLMNCRDSKMCQSLYAMAEKVRKQAYGSAVYIRGLIEISNYCRNDCYYCGIRKDNGNIKRYHLTKEEILDCCRQGYERGFRTFVLQGGEDASYTDKDICGIIEEIKLCYPDCAITLSLGEKDKSSYQAYYDAGADRYLLRHETALENHYKKLHPEVLSLAKRKECLYWLKEIGYQTGSGFMVGSPFQNTENLIADIRFLQELRPSMIGIGPFIPHKDTPFAQYPKGDLTMCLNLIAILRLLFPYALIPATTALGTLHPEGRQMGLCVGANVVMPNLSPVNCRRLYALYNDKLSANEESAEGLEALKRQVESIGYEIVTDRGDAKQENA